MRGSTLPTFILLIFALLFGSVVYSASQAAIKIMSNGQIVAVNVQFYSDATCTQPVTQISWGVIYPAQNVTKNLFMKSTGNVRSAVVMSTSNWNPTNTSQYISLKWNWATNIDPQQIVLVIFTLSVASNIKGITDFTFDINVVAQG